MITLTDSAATKIKELQKEMADKDKIMRVFVDSGGCSGFEYGMSFDQKKNDDVIIESKNITFAVDSSSISYLKNSEIDFDDGLHGKGFEVKNPNAQNTCGCGKSFN